MFLAKKVYRPRYKGLTKAKALRTTIEQAKQIVSTLKPDPKNLLGATNQLEKDLNDLIVKIKTTNISAKEIDRLHTALFNKISETITAIKSSKKAAEEEQRMKKIQQQMEIERKQREELERKRKQGEEEHKKRLEMEAQRKKEELRRRQLEEEEKKKQQELEEIKRQYAKEAELQAIRDAILEQERRDHELAKRLANDFEQNQAVLASTPPTTTPQLKRGQVEINRRLESSGKQNDLAKFSYAELRDTINNSCDIELLSACKEELHRRLKVYHQWKSRNSQKNRANQPQRAPNEIVRNAAIEEDRKQFSSALSVLKQDAGSQQGQRFFRVPFIRPCDVHLDPKQRQKGWWFAHFDGQFVVRQLELHPNKQPVLLVAGKDDLRMCELSMDETGLTRKKGAEIFEREFDSVWAHYGGDQYLMDAVRRGLARQTYATYKLQTSF